jgi:hypothetical protein
MTSSPQTAAVIAARRVQALSRWVQLAGIVVAALSVIGAIALARLRVDSTNCVHVSLAGSLYSCPHSRHPLVLVAVAGEFGVLFAILVVVLAAQYAYFRAGLFLAQADAGNLSRDIATNGWS